VCRDPPKPLHRPTVCSNVFDHKTVKRVQLHPQLELILQAKVDSHLVVSSSV
jgi:hypothetical protein